MVIKSMKKQKLLIILGAVIVIALVVVIISTRQSGPKNVSEQAELNNPEIISESGLETKPLQEAEPKDQFRSEVPKDIKIPEVNEVLSEEQKKEIAVPTVVTEAAPGVESKFRSYDISGDGGKFIPSKIIAKVGDTVHVNFTAIDKDYDIVFPSYNMKQIAKQGQTKILEFQALQSGNFVYYCEMCGGPESSTKGSFIIVE